MKIISVDVLGVNGRVTLSTWGTAGVRVVAMRRTVVGTRLQKPKHEHVDLTFTDNEHEEAVLEVGRLVYGNGFPGADVHWEHEVTQLLRQLGLTP